MDTKKPVTLRLSEEHLEIIEDAAKRAGVTRSAFIRMAALGYAYSVTSYETWQPVLTGIYAPIMTHGTSNSQEPPTPPGPSNGRNPRRRSSWQRRRSSVVK